MIVKAGEVSEPLSVQALGRVLLRHWILVLLCSLLAGSAALAASYLIPRTYTATATQLVKGLPGRGTTPSYEAAQFALSRAKSYPSFIYSSIVLEGVRNDLDNRESLVDLRQDLAATNPPDTPLIVITATGQTPAAARDKANSAATHMARFITQIETVAGTSPIGIETPVEASLPTDMTSPKRLLMGAVGALVGFALGTIAALVRSQRLTRRRPRRTDDNEVQLWWSDSKELTDDLPTVQTALATAGNQASMSARDQTGTIHKGIRRGRVQTPLGAGKTDTSAHPG